MKIKNIIFNINDKSITSSAERKAQVLLRKNLLRASTNCLRVIATTRESISQLGFQLYCKESELKETVFFLTLSGYTIERVHTTTTFVYDISSTI